MTDFSAQDFQDQVESLVARGYNRDRAVQLVYGNTQPGRKTPAGKATDRAISHGQESLKGKLRYSL